MDESVNIGLDFGSLGFRAAYLNGDDPIELQAAGGPDDRARWLIEERAPAAVLGVNFPSVKNRLGRGACENPEEAARIENSVRQELIDLRRLSAEHIGKQPRQLVISVPALYSANRRAALRDLGLSAGFTDVHLLNDSMAAVIGHTANGEDPRTVLVYSLGYSGFEVGLIRVAKGKYRAIGYDGAPSPGGAVFDVLVLRGCLQVFAKLRLWSPGYDLPADEWLKLRGFAERLKEMLSESDDAELVLGIKGAMQQALPLCLSRQEFEGAVRGSIDASLDAAERLLDDANLSITDLQEVLLIGGSAHLGLVQRLVADRFNRQPSASSHELLARGAAIYAARLGQLPTTDTAIIRLDDERNAEAPSSVIPVLNISLAFEDGDKTGSSNAGVHKDPTQPALPVQADTVLTLNSISAVSASDHRGTKGERLPSVETVLANRERVFQYARQLIDQRSHDRAQGFLEGLVEEAKVLLTMIPPRPGSAMKHEAEQILKRCHDLLRKGRYQQAVEFAHMAYAADPESPQVFEQTIDVHCKAAMAHASVDGYKKSMQWLMCAHSHDRTNTVIHDRIAERHFIHAREMAELGNSEEALKALEECQYFNPEHEGAKKLRETIAAAV